MIECKCLGRSVTTVAFLTLLGRLVDIRANPKYQDLNIRGALVTTKGWNKGVEKLIRHYSEFCSIFVAAPEGIKRMIHTHFIKPKSILSGPKNV